VKPLVEALSVYPIIVPSLLSETSVTDFATRLIEGGARILQLRHKQGTSRQFLDDAIALAELCTAAGVYLIINDRLDIALASSAHGVHLGPGDLPPDAARKLGPDLIIGASAGSVEAALAAQSAGADYLGCGAVYDASPTKPDASRPRGAAFIRSIVDAVSIPVVGIGGITAARTPEVMSAGANGVAVIREVLGDPKASVRQLISQTRHAG